MIYIAAFGAVFATLMGGLLALRFSDRLHLILGFSAGAIIGVVFFELIPEAINLAADNLDISQITSIIALGFVVYLLLDRFFIGHGHTPDICEKHSKRGRLGAGSLAIHSLMDGLIIGFAFQVSIPIALIVTFAVLAHDFSDGINTVGLILKSNGTKKEAYKWLALDAIAPAIGIVLSFFIKTNQTSLSIILATFSGFFLYIGASELLPESHHEHPTHWTTLMTVAGIIIIYFVVSMAS